MTSETAIHHHKMKWIRDNVNEGRVERLISRALSEMPQRRLQRTIKEKGHLQATPPVTILDTYCMELVDVTAEEHEHGTHLLFATFNTITEFEADLDSEDPTNQDRTQSTTLDLESQTTARITVENDGILDMSIEEIEF